MAVSEIIEFYSVHSPVLLPHTVPGDDGFVVEELHVSCSSCDAELTNPHGTAIDRTDSTEFLLAGLCQRCSCITQSRMRIYADGRLLHQSKDGWTGYEFLTWWERLRHRLRKWLSL